MPSPSPYHRYLLWLIVATAALRLFVAANVELGNDESYYWLYSLDLRLNYFDHPGMVALWARASTLFGLLPDDPLPLRLLSIAGGALSTFFIFGCASTLASPRAGWLAALLYNASLYATLTAGTYLMPDAPQMVFYTAALWVAACLVRNDGSWKLWILFGLLAGLCIMSKVHGAFLWLGMGLHALLHRRHWLASPPFWTAATLTALVVSPILFWNIEYDFATYRFHRGRVNIEDASRSFHFPRELAQQVIFNNPLVFFTAGWSLWQVWKRRKHLPERFGFWVYTGLPLAALLLFFSLFRDTTLPHWSGPAYVALIPMAAAILSKKSFRWPERVAATALGLAVAIVLAWVGMVNFWPGTLGAQKPPENLGYGDITLDAYGWGEASRLFGKQYQQKVAAGEIPAGTPLVSTYWWGAHVEYYFARPHGITLLGLGPMHEVRHYLWANAERLPVTPLDTALSIMPADESYPLPTLYYDSVKLLDKLTIYRGGLPAHRFHVYMLTGWRGGEF